MFCCHFSTAVKDLLALPFAFWRKGSGPGQPLWLTGGWGGHRRGWLCLIPSQTAGVVSLLPFPCCRLAGASKGPTSQEGGRLLSCLPPEVVPVAQRPSPGARGAPLHQPACGAWGLWLQAPGGCLGSDPASAMASVSTPGRTLWDPRPWPHLEPLWGRGVPTGAAACHQAGWATVWPVWSPRGLSGNSEGQSHVL